MKISLAAGGSNGQACIDCAVRPLSICAALDRAELRELDHLGRHVHFGPRETVFAQEQMTTSFYNLLEGVMRLYKLLPRWPPADRGICIAWRFPGDDDFRTSQLLRRRDRSGCGLPVLQNFLRAIYRG
jgi:hypothetical protein